MNIVWYIYCFLQRNVADKFQILEMVRVLRLGILSLLTGHSIGLVCYTCSVIRFHSSKYHHDIYDIIMTYMTYMTSSWHIWGIGHHHDIYMTYVWHPDGKWKCDVQGKNGECSSKADPGQASTCKSVRKLFLESKW